MTAKADPPSVYEPLFGLNIEVPEKYLQEALKNPDAVQVAVELGRLDLASALIAAVGLIVAIFGLIGFFEIRSRAKRVAREEAKKAAAQALPSLLPEIVMKVLADNPNILTSVLRDNPALLGMAIARIDDARNLLYGDIDADEAEEIASTMEGGEDVSP